MLKTERYLFLEDAGPRRCGLLVRTPATEKRGVGGMPPELMARRCSGPGSPVVRQHARQPNTNNSRRHLHPRLSSASTAPSRTLIHISLGCSTPTTAKIRVPTHVESEAGGPEHCLGCTRRSRVRTRAMRTCRAYVSVPQTWDSGPQLPASITTSASPKPGLTPISISSHQNLPLPPLPPLPEGPQSNSLIPLPLPLPLPLPMTPPFPLPPLPMHQPAPPFGVK